MSAQPIPKLLEYQDVLSITGYSRSGIDKLRKQGRFPEPIKHGKKCCWTTEDMTKYFSERVAERDARQAARDGVIEVLNAC